ncbi:hypothetical protein HDU84_001405 [Entophlyctis sp. JEL0112]|nr:hypothetical protein HDU84_001405 [Entophlyctis sp. JEL0112]
MPAVTSDASEGSDAVSPRGVVPPRAAYASLFSTSASRALVGSLRLAPDEHDPSVVQATVSILPDALSPGSVHAVHIHNYGDPSHPLGMAMAGHFNPTNTPHGCPASDASDTHKFHAGDLGSVTVAADGSASFSWSRRPLALADLADPSFVLGRGVIVHELVDDCQTQPTGNAGSRLAQGVLVSMSQANDLKNVPSVEDAIAFFHEGRDSDKIGGSIVFVKHSDIDPLVIANHLHGLVPNSMYRLGILSGDTSTLDTTIMTKEWCISFSALITFASDEEGKSTGCSVTIAKDVSPGVIYSTKNLVGRNLVVLRGSNACIGNEASAKLSFLGSFLILRRC